MAPDAPDSYGARVEEIYGYALKTPGFVSIKDFAAEDGERVALVEFETEAQSRAWGQHPSTARRSRKVATSTSRSTACRSAKWCASRGSRGRGGHPGALPPDPRS